MGSGQVSLMCVNKLKNIVNVLSAASILLFLFPALSGCGQDTEAPPVQLSYTIVKEYPHDRTAFTQGLAWGKGVVYEGTGLNGQSSLRRVDLETGRVEQRFNYDPQFFAEGITAFQDSIYQLTWTNGIIFQYDKRSFARLRSWPWPHEGWGITHDGRQLIVSDGTANLYFLSPETLTEQRRIVVHDGGQEIRQLNELEYVNGLIYANVWKECRIAVISSDSGAVAAWLDLSELCARMQKNGDSDAVLNGIMHAPESDRLFVTGKLWPTLFEIKLAPAGQKQS